MSSLKQALSRGEVVCGAGATTFAPAIVETYGAAGMDFVWIDFEHKGPSSSDGRTLENLVRAAECAGTELLVRLPRLDPALARKVLDAGVQNVLFPRVKTAVEVRRIARATTFVYDGEPGERGVANARASNWGAGGFEPANDPPGFGVMIETARAVENLEAILSVPGLDFAYLGPADLSISLGYPFETDHPEVRDAIDIIRTECDEVGVPLGRSVNDPAVVQDAVDEGWQLLRYGDEIDALRQRLAEFDADVWTATN